MSPAPRVSVVVPFCDTPPAFLEEAVGSVFGQTDDDWELLLVDDGSKESVSRAARDLAAGDPRARCLEHPGHENRGQSASRNLAIAHARGEFVAFLDSDDVWLPYALEEQVGLLTAHPRAGMLYGNTLYWHSWSPDQAGGEPDYVPDLRIAPGRLIEPPGLVPLFLRGRAAIPCPSAVAARREVVAGLGGFVETAPRPNEDQFFFAKMALHVPIVVAPGCWALYRQHAGSISAPRPATEMRRNRKTYLTWLGDYARAQGIEDPDLGRALRRELWNLRHPRSARVLRLGRRAAGRVRSVGRRRP